MLVARSQLGPLTDDVAAAVASLVEADAVRRLWSRDHTLFSSDPDECADRMGWLGAPDRSAAEWPALAVDADGLAGEVDRVLVMGMGGSSLFPEVLATTFPAGPDHPSLEVLDTTHPDAVARALDRTPAARTFALAASKSGSTVETRSQLDLWWDRLPDGRRAGVVTDPGSALAELAASRGIAHTWLADPDVGGRFSALTAFGMVPAALAGLDGPALLEAGQEAAALLAPGDDDAEGHLGLHLGAAIGAAAAAGRDQLTILVDPRIGAFGAWLEQLVAESLGKHGVGVTPLVGEPPDVVAATPERRLVVTIGDVDADGFGDDLPRLALGLEELTDLGAQVFWWEVATALAGRVMGINPFDQPDVEAAKAAARAVLAGGRSEPATTPLEEVLGWRRDGDVVTIGAFVDPGGPAARRLEEVRVALGRRLGVPTALGIGPRFLHSTGQLHKGGPDRLVFLQVVEPHTTDVAIPGQPYSFGDLIAAQAAGDLEALRSAGRRAARVSLDELLASA